MSYCWNNSAYPCVFLSFQNKVAEMTWRAWATCWCTSISALCHGKDWRLLRSAKNTSASARRRCQRLLKSSAKDTLVCLSIWGVLHVRILPSLTLQGVCACLKCCIHIAIIFCKNAVTPCYQFRSQKDVLLFLNSFCAWWLGVFFASCSQLCC